MGIFVGFERLHVGIWDKDETAVTKKYVWEGKNGGTVNMNITGLAADKIDVWASNQKVWMSSKGTGDVKADIELFNAPEAELNETLGLEKVGNAYWYGSETQPPYVAVIGESADENGEPIYIALPKGTLSKDGIQISTLEEKAKAPENDKLSMSCVNALIGGKSRVLGQHYGSEGADEFMESIFVGLPPQLPAG